MTLSTTPTDTRRSAIRAELEARGLVHVDAIAHGWQWACLPKADISSTVTWALGRYTERCGLTAVCFAFVGTHDVVLAGGTP